MHTVVVRTARSSDMDEIMRLYRQLMAFHEALDSRLALDWDRIETFRDYLTDVVMEGALCRLLVAEAPTGPGLAGFILGRLADNPPIFAQSHYGLVSDVCVDERWRRRGIGRVLFEAMREWFREQGVLTMQLNAATRNPVSQAFWRAMGFTDLLDLLWCEA